MNNRWKLYDEDSFDKDVELLGELARGWRRGKHGAEATAAYAVDYEEIVVRLINSGKWFDMPPPEDQLPEALMPQQFYEYWNLERNKPLAEVSSEDYLCWVIMGVGIIWITVVAAVWMIK